jgi:hypothetical protein
MGNDVPVPSVEIGRIVFRSWEHQWQTDEREAPSVASAKRLLSEHVTRPIYEILESWQRDLLRSSLPFSPYGLRVRPANNDWMAFADGFYHLVELLRRSQAVGQLCPNWDEALPEPQEKRTKYGALLRAPFGDTPLNTVYEVVWRPAVFPETVSLDKLLRQFSPRYKEPTIFG